ncbi:uncharacterized protein LOC135203815 [Macrobrachium nipponense]|uniref:uncharacterized protein LOC135203815 n=1 Tax=Macrobrachium nipponense TaxID=159736 RepID=UPI0030C8355D
MGSLSLCASIHILIGGLGLLLNVAATIFTIKRVKRPLNTTVIYKISDTISGAIGSLLLFCDGFLYFGNSEYTYSCHRYFIIYFLVLFPIITSNFSILGVAIDHYLTAKNDTFRSTSCQQVFRILWTATYWFTTAASIIILWGNTEKDGKFLGENTFYWKTNELIRLNRGLLEDLWAHNSKNDWSSDFRENAIIGLVYGIIGGNISHEALKNFHGNPQSVAENQRQIHNLHAALGIRNSDFQKVFGTNLTVNSQNSKETTNNSPTILEESSNSLEQSENHSESNIFLKKGNISGLFKPSHGLTIDRLQQNSVSNHNWQNHSETISQNTNKEQHLDFSNSSSGTHSQINTGLDKDQFHSTKNSTTSTHMLATTTHTGKGGNANSLNIRNNANTDPKPLDSSFPNGNKGSIAELLVIRTEVPNPDSYDVTLTPQDVSLTPEETTSVPETLPTESDITATSQETFTEPPTTIKPDNNFDTTTSTSQTTEVESTTENPNTINYKSSTPSNHGLTQTDGSLHTLKITSACRPQVGFFPPFIMIIIICVHGLPLLTSGFLNASTGCDNQRCTRVNDLNSRHSNKSTIQQLTRKAFIILTVNFLCWTPFLFERLLYAWERTPALPIIVPSLLFILAQMYNIIRAVFYIFDNEEFQVNMQVSLCLPSRCCKTTVLPISNAHSETTSCDEISQSRNSTRNGGMATNPSPRPNVKSIPMINLRY